VDTLDSATIWYMLVGGVEWMNFYIMPYNTGVYFHLVRLVRKHTESTICSLMISVYMSVSVYFVPYM
jgi:hypothetical protein